MSETAFGRRVEAVRRFNRFYTRQIGVLHEKLLESRFSLIEVRVLYELAHRDKLTARQLVEELRIDPGYLSRILAGFAKQGLILKTPSKTDGRQSLLALTAKGKATFAPLDQGAHDEIAEMMRPLPAATQRRLVAALEDAATLFGAPAEPDRAPYLLRPHEPGDMGEVVALHGRLYAEEFGWNAEFEALVAEIAAKFLRHFDSSHERCWIAERHGEVVGSVFVVKETERSAKLRLLIVAPEARGLGIGERLVAECIAFARRCGYRRLRLWTNDVLVAARAIYRGAGFRLVASRPHNDFGPPMVGEDWELSLR